MRGTYRFYQDGKLIAESENLLTNAGKAAILSYLAGYTGNFAVDICLGAGSTAATVNDTELVLQWSRTPIVTISPDYINTKIVYKARLDESAAGIIYEAGIRSQASVGSEYTSKTLVDFTPDTPWVNGTFVTSNARVGSHSLRLAPAASATLLATLADTYLDLSGYSNTDEFRLGYSPNNSNTASVLVRFYTDSSNYFTHTISAPASGYKVATFSKSNFVATGSPSWDNITSVGVSVTASSGGAASVDIDTLQIVDKDNYSEYDVLISRSVLGGPIAKAAGLPMDIEYTLDVTL